MTFNLFAFLALSSSSASSLMRDHSACSFSAALRTVRFGVGRVVFQLVRNDEKDDQDLGKTYEVDLSPRFSLFHRSSEILGMCFRVFFL